MPALRPGLGCLLVAKSGRRAPLGLFQKNGCRLCLSCGVAESRLRLNGRGGNFVQRVATPASAGGWQTDEKLMPSRIAKMEATFPQDSEEFAALIAAPFLLRHVGSPF
jgi:hypothetical protein